VTLTMMGELKDMALCKMAIEQVRESVDSKWLIALRVKNFWRRFVFLPGVRE
jgi:hypothetical protein